MTIAERVAAEFLTAMKAKDAVTLSTVRLLKSALKNKQIDLMRELTEEEAQAVVKSQIKQLKDSITDFEKAGRADLADPAKIEAAFLERYLPAQMDDAALEAAVTDALAGAGMTSKADAGRAMGVAMKAVAGLADAGRVKAVVDKVLVAVALLAVIQLALPHAVFAAGGAPVAEAGATVLSLLRILRAFLLLLGIAAVNMLLVGGFTFMVAGGRDHAHEAGMSKMSLGVLATIVVFAVFAIVTVAIQNLGGAQM